MFPVSGEGGFREEIEVYGGADRLHPAAEALIDDLGESNILLAVAGYDSDAIRAKVKERKAWANIPPRTNRNGTFAFSAWLYRQRNLVEHFFNRIKHLVLPA